MHHKKMPSPFFWQSFFFICIWGTLAFFCFRLFQSITKDDQVAYQQLMLQSDAVKSTINSSYEAQQQRFNVHKHLILSEKSQRLHYRLHSAHSELVLNQQDNKTELLERFKAFTGLMQEELTSIDKNPCQYVRYIEAETAVYHYKTKELIAENVHLVRYLAPGHQLMHSFKQLKPLMDGRAKQVRLSLTHGNKAFKAQGFELTFQDLGKSL